ncbi:MAG: hypothetical protein KME64_32025 [Scytonematopsis contorta HA4267-MV1]|jgi:hypothetical protein|nr:hypothetical protein [Scytonematopsis contorta HA4267-MV1]
MPIVYPLCWRIIKRGVYNDRLGWSFERRKVFVNLTDIPTPENFDSIDWEIFFRTSKATVVTELFRINGGKFGYYLANLIELKYYYCGATEDDLINKFVELGVVSGK